MKDLNLVPELDACDFTGEVEEEMTENDISTHYQNDTMYLDWSEPEEMPVTKAWLIETYGEVVKEYKGFAICAT